MSKRRLIFLDIDGPMIPSGCYLAYGKMASFKRKYSPISVALINRLCHESGAKIVFNTTHNVDGEKLIEDSIREGIKKGHIYSGNCQTEYPKIPHRLDAIHYWLGKNPSENETIWIAIDDVFINNYNGVLINFDYGISLIEFDECIKKLGKGKTPFIL